MANYEGIALNVPQILLPRADIDLGTWSVVACDQYTSEPEQWENIRSIVGTNPSTLNIIFPEVYLEDGNQEKRIKAIHQTMHQYLKDQVLIEQRPGFVLLDRQTADTPSRKGLIVALDLDQYDFTPRSKSLIRATEGTVLERIPPRIKIRHHAPLECPHIMVLIDDPGQTVIEPLFDLGLPKIYDFDLMQDSGHVTGYLLADKPAIDQVASRLAILADPRLFQVKYGTTHEPVLLYAIGDGNHSLATAKTIWETMKKRATDRSLIMNDPARYALVELVNVHDPGLHFEPIHRVLFNIDPNDLFTHLQAYFENQRSPVVIMPHMNLSDLAQHSAQYGHAHHFPFVSHTQSGIITIQNPRHILEYATLQPWLDQYINERPAAKIDYVHGDAVVAELGSKPEHIGFSMPAIAKQALFKTIILDGTLPRKAFSMGHAHEKRFYLECRQII